MGKGGLVGLSHEYKVCKCPHIHKKLQPKKISIPIALFRPRQNIKRHRFSFNESSLIDDSGVTYEFFIFCATIWKREQWIISQLIFIFPSIYKTHCLNGGLIHTKVRFTMGEIQDWTIKKGKILAKYFFTQTLNIWRKKQKEKSYT